MSQHIYNTQIFVIQKHWTLMVFLFNTLKIMHEKLSMDSWHTKLKLRLHEF